MAIIVGTVQFRYRPMVINLTSSPTDARTIRFRENAAGPDLDAVVPAGRWPILQLCWEIKQAMEGVGEATYNAAYDRARRRFLIESDLTGGSGDFTIDTGSQFMPAVHLGTPTNVASGIWLSSAEVPPIITVGPTVGFYQRPRPQLMARRSRWTSESGAAWYTQWGEEARYAFSVEFEQPAIIQDVHAMIRDGIAHGEEVNVFLRADEFHGRMLPRSVQLTPGPYRRHTITAELIRLVPARRPSGLGTSDTQEWIEMLDRTT